MRRRVGIVSVAVWLGVWLAAAGAAGAVEPPVLLGIYSDQSWFPTPFPGGPIPAAGVVKSINDWFVDPGKALSLGGTFQDFEFDPVHHSFNVPTELEGIWSAGAVPFVNVAVGFVPGRTMAQVAAGAADEAIRQYADALRRWLEGSAPSQHGPRRAFIAPFQEMNGYWLSYGQDPVNFKLGYQRVRDIFQQQGVPFARIRWVFAPNGFAAPGQEFEKYYPGNATVDVVGFSAYNFGTCGPSRIWDTFAIAIKPYLDRMRVMAPSKPIFLAQTGSVNLGGDKNLWLDDTYTQLEAYPALRAVVYFHMRRPQGLPCDPVEWRFYVPSEAIEFPGIKNAVTRNPGFGHWDRDAAEWATIAFAPQPPSRFDDVQASHPFAGVPNVFFFDAVQSLVGAGVTGGCSTAPPLYCPDDSVTREQMAVFLLKAKLGPGHVPPPCTTAPFADVPCGSLFATWIQELVARGITAGCGGGNYCPRSPVTREQMAVFLLKTFEGSAYTPPSCTSDPFDDVSCSSPFAPWIQELVNRGITAGCSATSYCPTSPVTRGQMAVFLVNTFGL